MRLTVILITLAILASCGSVEAGSVSLIWDNPTTNTDGSPITNLTGVIVSYRQNAWSYTTYTSTPVISAPSTGGGFGSTTVGGLADGNWYFGCRAINAKGINSDWSSILSTEVTNKPGKALRFRFR